MNLTYVDKLTCEHVPVLVHYGSPNDRNYLICSQCSKYTTLYFSHPWHRGLNLFYALGNLGPVLVASSGYIVAIVLYLHH